MSEIEIGIRESPWIAPGAGMDGCGAHEGAEMKLPRHCENPSVGLDIIWAHALPAAMT
jgi:hypothetical protein